MTYILLHVECAKIGLTEATIYFLKKLGCIAGSQDINAQ